MPVSIRSWACASAVLAAAPLVAAPRTYVVDPAQSAVRIHVGKSGAFSFAGHTHEVAAPALSGEVTADPAEPAGDPPKVEEAMRGPKVLDAARFPTISFKSQRVSGREAGGGAYDLELAGELALHGVTRPITLPVHVEVSGDTLTASGKTVLRHDQFGMQPVSVAGVVKVKNEIAIDYRIVARGR